MSDGTDRQEEFVEVKVEACPERLTAGSKTKELESAIKQPEPTPPPLPPAAVAAKRLHTLTFPFDSGEVTGVLFQVCRGDEVSRKTQIDLLDFVKTSLREHGVPADAGSNKPVVAVEEIKRRLSNDFALIGRTLREGIRNIRSILVAPNKKG